MKHLTSWPQLTWKVKTGSKTDISYNLQSYSFCTPTRQISWHWNLRNWAQTELNYSCYLVACSGRSASKFRWSWRHIGPQWSPSGRASLQTGWNSRDIQDRILCVRKPYRCKRFNKYRKEQNSKSTTINKDIPVAYTKPINKTQTQSCILLCQVWKTASRAAIFA